MVRNNILNLRIREQFLFTDEEMNPRQTADREEVLNVFTPLAHSIVSKILEAGDCYLEIAERYPIARQESTFTSSFLHGLIIEKLSQIETVRLTQPTKRNSIVEIGSYKVWVKKLDERGLPWINETKSSVKRINQKVEGEDNLPILILGYQLSQLEHISQITLLYIEGDQHLWAPINLGDIAATSHIDSMTNIPSEGLDVHVKLGKERSRKKQNL